MKEKKSVSLDVVREVLKKAGEMELLDKMIAETRKPIRLKRGVVKSIEEKINGADGVVIVRRRNDGKGVLLYGKEHIKWNFRLNRVSKTERQRLNAMSLKVQGKRLPKSAEAVPVETGAETK